MDKENDIMVNLIEKLKEKIGLTKISSKTIHIVLKEAMELSKKLTQQQKLDEKTIRVGEEPEHNPKMNTRLQLKYPDGTRTIRRFSKTATLSLVCDFIDIEMITKNLEIENYSLNMNFPKRTFCCRDEETSKLTLEEAGLHPQAVLFIQNLDA